MIISSSVTGWCCWSVAFSCSKSISPISSSYLEIFFHSIHPSISDFQYTELPVTELLNFLFIHQYLSFPCSLMSHTHQFSFLNIVFHLIILSNNCFFFFNGLHTAGVLPFSWLGTRQSCSVPSSVRCEARSLAAQVDLCRLQPCHTGSSWSAFPEFPTTAAVHILCFVVCTYHISCRMSIVWQILLKLLRRLLSSLPHESS